MTKDEIVKQEIVLKAQQLFRQFGLKKTTMDEIAYSCGKAKSTLYHYFKSKEEVFKDVISLEIRNLRKTVKDQVDDVKTAKLKLRTYFLTFHKTIHNKLNLYRSIKQELSESDCTSMPSRNRKEKFAVIKNFMDFERNYLTRILDDAYDSGEFTKVPKEEIAFFAETLIAAFFGIMSYSIETESLNDYEKLEKTADILLDQVFS